MVMQTADFEQLPDRYELGWLRSHPIRKPLLVKLRISEE
jgi:hypothetical protein